MNGESGRFRDKMPRKLPDEMACRRFIRQQRSRERKTIKTKIITITLDHEDGKKINSLLVVHVYKGTNSVALCHGLKYYKSMFFPSKNQKLSCKSEHGLEELKKRRERTKLIMRNYKAMNFYTGIGIEDGSKLSSLLSIHANPKTDSIILSHAIEYRNVRIHPNGKL